MQIPLRVLLPSGVLELMLHVEQPYTRRSREQHDRKVHEQECLETDESDERGNRQRDRKIGRHGAGPRLPATPHHAHGQTVLQKKQIGGREAEHHQRMTVETVLQPTPARARAIFSHRQRVDVAEATAVEIAGGGMVDSVRTAPEVVWCQREHTDGTADPVIRQFLRKESTMTTVM